jgi:membrane protease YdiL (CAAX protease family)
VSQPGRLARGQSQPGRLARGQSVVARRRPNAVELLVVLGAALALRLLGAGTAGAASEPGAAVFAVLLLGAAARAGWRPGRLRPSALAWGVLGAVGLVAGPAVLRLAGPPHPLLHVTAAGFPLWAVVVTGVALGEEVLLRGALFAAIDEAVGVNTALVATTVVFALVHVPLYGVHALPLDLAVGLWLGGLRVATGGVAAPATAHAVADLAGWWLW